MLSDTFIQHTAWRRCSFLPPFKQRHSWAVALVSQHSEGLRLQKEVQEGWPAQIPRPNTVLCHLSHLLHGIMENGFLIPWITWVPHLTHKSLGVTMAPSQHKYKILYKICTMYKYKILHLLSNKQAAWKEHPSLFSLVGNTVHLEDRVLNSEPL